MDMKYPELLLATNDQETLDDAVVIAKAICTARDLVHTPANIKNPAWLAEEAVRIGKEFDFEVKVLSGKELAEFGGLRAVGNSSPKPGPRFVELSYVPRSSKKNVNALEHVVLVGKGITFDTGGVSLKRPYDTMIAMKSDMAGAAAILAKRGKSVIVLESSDKFGGAVRTEEVTLPGFHHDLFATNLSLFAGGGVMALLKEDLIRNGLEFIPSDKPYCSVFPDGKSIGITMDREKNIKTLQKKAPLDVESWNLLTAKLGQLSPHLFPILGTELPSLAAAKLLFKSWRAIGTTGLFELIRLLLQSSRAFADEYFAHAETKALAAAWGMHLDYAPDISGGALFSFLESIIKPTRTPNTR